MSFRALTIAGLDPSGGAGILADTRTFSAFGLDASAAITSITFQTEARLFGALHQSAETVRAQVEPLLEAYTIDGAKTGMLPTSEVVKEVARLFRETNLPAPVVDPVIVSTSGYELIEKSAAGTLIEELLPLARVVTPNIPEAERLAGIKITSENDLLNAAAKIRALGARAVLIKSGHLELPDAVDVLDDEGRVTLFREPRIAGGELHGSGCMLSAGIAAGLGQGKNLAESVDAAKKYVLEKIRKTVLAADERG